MVQCGRIYGRLRPFETNFVFISFLFVVSGKNVYESSILTNRCYSCMSEGYRDLFREGELHKYFFEPKNFTDQCDHPINPSGIGFVPCRTICLTLIQDLVVMGRSSGKRLTMRGCSTSLNKRGFVNRTMHLFDRFDMCREVQMSDLFNYEAYGPPVTVCSCLGDKCNGIASSGHPKIPSILLLAVLTGIYSYHYHNFTL
uniref:Homolog of Odr-2 (Two) n=1 Tax=Panagrellus redivivus TaxID=6233 RepID=A0A7E4V1Z1_PANRE